MSDNNTFDWDGTSTSSFVGQTGYDTVKATVNTTALSLGGNLNSIERVNINANALTSTQTLSVTVADSVFQSSLNLNNSFSGKLWGSGGFRGLTINLTASTSVTAAYSIDASALTAGHAVNINNDSGSADSLKGGAGDDIFRIYNGNDSVDGGAGNDTVIYNFAATALSNLTLTGNAGAGWSLKSGTDTLLGFARLSDGAVQVSDLRASGSALGVDVLRNIESLSLIFDTADSSAQYVADIGIDSTSTTTTLSLKVLQNYIVGTSAGEVITGTGAADLISAGAGNDTVNGGAGGDLFVGESIFGGAGDDSLDGGAGWNQLYGGAGNDTLTGGSGGLTWYGSLTPERNIANYGNVSTGITAILGNSDVAGASAYNQGTVTGDASVGTDTLLVISRVVGSSGNDSYTVKGNWYASQVKNWFQAGYLGQGSSFRGGAGDDTVTGNGYIALLLDQGSGSVYASIADGIAYGDGIGTDRFTGVNALQGGVYNDTLIGGSGNDAFTPAAGDDSVDGGAGSDTVAYGFESPTQGVTVDLSLTTAQLINADAGYDTLLNIENVLGTTFADQIKGSDANNKFQGGLGNDTIDGGAGTDTAVFDGLSTDFEVKRLSDGSWTVKDTRSVPKEDMDTLIRVEDLQFNDKTTSLNNPPAAKFWKDNTKAPADTKKADAVNLTDAIAILKMIVGLNVNSNNTALSPYQAIAADFDQSGDVGLTDAIGVLKMVVGLSAPTPTWKYYDDTQLNSAYTSAQSLNPKVWTGTALVSDPSIVYSEVKLVGVLSGDVDGSWTGA
jgi:Ca2+-binding RTX toxin-like protein